VSQHPYGESDQAWGALPTSSGTAAQIGVIGPIPIPTCAASPAAPAPVVVSSSMTLSGMTVAQFTFAAQTAFKTALASQLSVSFSQIAVTGVTPAAAAGRHLLQSSIVVAFTVTTTSAAAATSITSGIASAATSPAFQTALNTQLTAVGAPTVSGVAATPAVVAGAPPAAAPMSAAPDGAVPGIVSLTLAVASTVMFALMM
jgi:hypothetical protein